GFFQPINQHLQILKAISVINKYWYVFAIQ
ncbi:MAG: hypothetical protein ACI9S7_001247, partial [Candidatus Paceibacteria bacterium]